MVGIRIKTRELTPRKEIMVVIQRIPIQINLMMAKLRKELALPTELMTIWSRTAHNNNNNNNMQRVGKTKMEKEMKMDFKECCLAFQEQLFIMKVTLVIIALFLP